MRSLTLRETCVDIVEKLQKLSCDNAIATAFFTTKKQVKFANSKIVRSSVEESETIHVFASIENKVAETTIDVKEENLQKVLFDFVELTKKLPPNSDFAGIASEKYTYEKLNSFDKKISLINEGCIDVVEQALETCSGVKASGIFETNEHEVFLHSSAGPHCSEKGTNVYFSIKCNADKNASGHKVAADNFLKNISVAELAREAKELALKARNPTKGQEGTYNVVFDALPFAALLNPFAHSTSAFAVETGLSVLKDKLGEKIASNCFTFYDDPLKKGAFNGASFDAEGQATKKTTLVENGVLKNYLHNTSTAKKYNAKPTGHSGIISPHPWNPSVKKGKASLDELIKEAKNGIYISNIWYTRFQNYSTGDFSTIPRDAIFAIENGELTKPINGIRISENLLNVLKNILLLSSNQRQIYGWEVETPIFSCDALIENVKITTSK